ncbi:hypothetical protein ACHAPT_013063 [Fusarium lateritium]
MEHSSSRHRDRHELETPQNKDYQASAAVREAQVSLKTKTQESGGLKGTVKVETVEKKLHQAKDDKLMLIDKENKLAEKLKQLELELVEARAAGEEKD